MSFFALVQDSLISYDLIIWCIAIGAILAFLINFFMQNVAGKVVRALISNDCIGEEKAKTLSELSLKPNFMLKWMLKEKGMLRSVVFVWGGRMPLRLDTDKSIPDFDSARFYIKDENEFKAAARFGRPMSVWYLILFTVLAIAAAYGMTIAMPYLMRWMGLI
ncbi:MAG: hypothetical protein J6B60_00400 [Clostridia bacterium]|nr:hypothetical protein [Clostridia bacterium]